MVATRNPIVALVGNPNTGKSTLFNALAGMNQRVGNFPGVTVETKKGKFRHAGQIIEVIDLPGTYSLAPRSPDEMVAVDVILGQQPGEPRPDLVITIVDASNLERNLYLTTQVMELGVPVVVALNMMDVATGQGVEIDVARLSKNLGVPVVALQANKHKGLDLLKDALVKAMGAGAPAHGPPFPDAFEAESANLTKTVDGAVPPFWFAACYSTSAGTPKGYYPRASRGWRPRFNRHAGACSRPAARYPASRHAHAMAGFGPRPAPACAGPPAGLLVGPTAWTACSRTESGAHSSSWPSCSWSSSPSFFGPSR